MANKTVTIRDIDSHEVNQISITKVAADWGIELFPSTYKDSLAYCPNPKHEDRSLGSCYFVEDGDKNFFYCFSCGEGGGPINLVMLIDQCSFVDAINKLAYKYDLVKYKCVAKEDLPPKWEGLSSEEYTMFGLKNVSVRAYKNIGENGKPVISFDRYTLRDLAYEDAEAHDELLINKYFERIYELAGFMSQLDNDQLKAYGISHDDGWEEAVIVAAKNYTSLLKKGVINKDTLHDVLYDREEMIKNALKEEIKRKLLGA